ncbi:MAG: EAL domain-containing protein [Mycobacteriales bacterium]|nr:EAL domain-containing protein [Mycobacteriales bacterium]
MTTAAHERMLLDLALIRGSADDVLARAAMLLDAPGDRTTVRLAPAPGGEPRTLEAGGGLDGEVLERVASVLDRLLEGVDDSEALSNQVRHLVAAQRISRVGSYDFEIATGTNRWSDELYRIYGREPQSFNASYEVFLSMLHPADREHVMAVHQRSLETLEPYEMEERVVWPDGQIHTLASWGEIVTDADGRPARMVGICWDITDRREMEAQLVRQSLHDSLTGLPNRTLLVDRLQHALARLASHRGTVGVLLLDVDRFKVVNDSLGHDVGDELLLALATRLQSLVRPGDTLARFGGDELVLLCPELGDNGQADLLVCTLAQELLDAVRQPLSVAGAGGREEVVLTASLGIALSSSATATAGALLQDADAALNEAKQAARGRAVLFEPRMRAAAVGRLDTELELRRALRRRELEVHYQPVVDLTDGRVTGFEALVRWRHPSRGLVLPSEFIGVAEETGLVVALGASVLDRACRQLAQWQDAGRALTVAVNLSGVQVGEPGLVPMVRDTVARSGVDPDGLTLEITETALMRDAEGALQVLTALRAIGVHLSVDDFGTGYSSLAYLRRFPVDVLKLDRSLVIGVDHDTDGSALAAAVLAMGRALGLTAIAEGVESAAQVAALRRLGFQRVQGFVFSGAVPAERCDDLLARPFQVPHQRSSSDSTAVESSPY